MAGDRRAMRLSILGVVALLLMGALGTRLWFLQMVDSKGLDQRVETLRTRVVRLAPERGRIFDAKGRILADNERVLNVVIDQDVIRNKAKTRRQLFDRLAGPLGTTSAKLEERFQHGGFDPVLPFPVAEDVDEQTAAFLRERIEDYPGVNVQEGWRRRYLYAPLASQIVGFLGAIPKSSVKTYTKAGYLLDERVGVAGIEQAFEPQLHGAWGEKVVEVDTSGNVVREISRTDPKPGSDIQLTIDLDYQQFAEQALETQLRRQRGSSPYDRDATDPRKYTVFFPAPAGSVVVEKSSTGEIAAMASYPTFDNRWPGSGISSQKFSQLFPKTAAYSPFNNLAIQGRYNVGSTFKPFTAYAALDNGFIQPQSVYEDTGTYTIDPNTCDATRFKCLFKNSFNFVTQEPTKYGSVTVADALAVSSDSFFYRIGAEMFLQDPTNPRLQNEYHRFGFGSRTGIDLPFEYKGIIPDAEAKRRLAVQGAISADEGQGFYVGDSVQMAIGQGLVAVTPLQLANAYATFANAQNNVGERLRPLIVHAIYEAGVPDGAAGFVDLSQGRPIKVYGKDVVETLPMDPYRRDPIVGGLERVVGQNGGKGTPGHLPTAVRVFTTGAPFPVAAAGKTGTAQGKDNAPALDSSVFAAFQTDNPNGYTIASYLEKAGYGANGSAPLVKCMMLAMNGLIQLDPVRLSDPLDLNSTQAAPDRAMRDQSCLNFNAGAIVSREH
jgi:penicillin-binding protein 2